jgi:uncharacterized protein YfkK (UPF0435 family)
MTLIELKNFITSGIVPTDFLILVDKDNQFLAKQYINALGELAPGGLNKISSIYEPFQSSLNLLTAPEGCINVLTVDTFEERSEDYSQFENTVVVCEQVDKSISKVVENYIIKLPKFEEWQIFDYAKTICPTIEDDDLTWLIQASEVSIERVINELDKAKLFDKNEQKQIFSAIRFDPQTDLYKVNLFTIVNALVEGDLAVLYDFLKRKNYDLLEPIVLVNRTFTSLKNILLIAQNPALTAEDCGVSAGQYNYIKRNYFSLNIEAVKQKLKFLVNFDLALKASQLDMPKRDMLTYIINNLAYKIRN